jgi:phosphatidylserine/phosphatidylglycerophosphate/cardiolipin synthase-like enzyme
MSNKFVSTRSFYDSLIKAKKRGVKVRIGMDRKKKKAIEFLEKNNIKVYIYDDKRIHHLKGIIVDDEYVFIGSQNITPSALRGKNWSSGVVFKSKHIATKFREYLKKLR